MNRNTILEQQLNTKRFEYHWLIEGYLTAVSNGTLYKWNSSKWTESDAKIPKDKQPKLFEDNNFIVFGDCHGEWGGTVYFLEKQTNKVFFTESTCTNTVYSDGGKYYVFAHLGHGIGSTELKQIPDPRNLSRAKAANINRTKNGEALGYSDKSKAYQKLLDFHGVQLFSTFKYRNKRLYIGYLEGLTFLTEIEDNTLQIVHPLFKNEIYTHDPVTSTYGEYTLINLDHYGTGGQREVSCMIIKDGQLTKLDWNKLHGR